MFPYVKGLQKRQAFYDRYLGFEPGHYYSPIAEPEEYKAQQKHFSATEEYVPAEIDFDEKGQLDLLHCLAEYYSDFSKVHDTETGRFQLDNVFFTYSDALGLYSMMRHKKPKRIIEIGSGFSSALMLDTNEVFFDSAITMTFIDPNTERLKSQLRKGEKIALAEAKIQDADPALFQSLEKGDFLLIDTSHVSKSGSDVNHIYFNILPKLKKGVIIHIHDIFFPFEYPAQWILKENRSWNEVFLLRAFLSFNPEFKVRYFNNFMELRHKAFFEENMPLALQRNSTVCGGIWLEKIN
jgi:predicted O-methyltransferase YrrM